MKEKNTFRTLFFIRKNKPLKNGDAPICMRITVNSIAQEIQIKRAVPSDKWSQSKERVLGNECTAFEINSYIDTLRNRILQIHRELETDNQHISALAIKEKYLGKTEAPKMLLEVFKEHNDKIRQLIDKDFSYNTVQRYARVLKYLGEYIQREYHKKDIRLSDIDHQFITGYEFFMKTVKNCQHNTAVKHLKCIKKITRIAIMNEWIKKDPFVYTKLREHTVEREFLLKEEIERIIAKKFSIPRLEICKDVFLFCCFTGLSFSDVKGLRKEHIVKGNNRDVWIRKTRQKTKNMCNIPLLELPVYLIKKYELHPDCLKTERIFPVQTNQKMNSYLKEIADLCGITKHLTTHLARHFQSRSSLKMNNLQIFIS